MSKNILLVNGFPGFLTNFNLVIALQRSGYNVTRYKYPELKEDMDEHAFSHIMEDVGQTLTAFYQNSDSVAVIAFCFGGWLVSQHAQNNTMPAHVKLIYMSPLLNLTSFRKYHEDIGNDLDEMLFESAPQLLNGSVSDWSQGWSEIESLSVKLDLPSTTSVVQADQDDLLDPNNMDIGRAIGKLGKMEIICSPHHYFDDQRSELIDKIHKLLAP